MPEVNPTENSNGEKNLVTRVERQFRRGNINFDFLNPIQPSRDKESFPHDRRQQARTGKRGIFNRGRPAQVFSGIYTLVAFVVLALSVVAMRMVWSSDHFLTLFAIPFLMSTALASLIVFGLFLARPR